jgi:hypothetical protein
VLGPHDIVNREKSAGTATSHAIFSEREAADALKDADDMLALPTPLVVYPHELVLAPTTFAKEWTCRYHTA